MTVNHPLEALKMNVFNKCQSCTLCQALLYPEIEEVHKLSPLGRNLLFTGRGTDEEL